MDIVTIDFETYYAKDFTLSKMTTEAYIRDDRFEVIGVSVKVNDNPGDWYTGGDPGGFLNSLDYTDKAILCHNTAFDGAILSWLYGIKPKFWFDTLSMAQPNHAVTVGGSLKNLVAKFHLGEKGTEVVDAFGKRRKDFTPAQMAAYGKYCINDSELTYKLFKKLKVGFPVSELMVIDQTIRMYTEPVLELDRFALERHLAEEKSRKQTLLNKLGNGDPAAAKKVLMSNPKFAELLTQLGATVPMKISPTTGKETFAFAKTDLGLLDLMEHPNPAVAAVTEVRLGVKSTIEETRTQRLIDVSKRGPLPIMLKYYAAHTGRFGGGDKLNMQNLPARGNNVIRSAICAPQGYKVVACDSSQIEARMLAYIAGQADLVQAFREGRDVYSEFATKVFGYAVTKANKKERFVGKTCIAEGTEVLCHTGWKPIERVTTEDKLWDGKEWVCHKGLVNNGIKETLSLCGSWLTPDHQVWSGTQWMDAELVVREKRILSQVLDTAAENLPLQATYKASVVGSNLSLWHVLAGAGSTLWIDRISKLLNQPAAQYVQKKLALRNGIGNMLPPCLMTHIGLGYSTASPLLSRAAMSPTVKRTSTTVSGASQYTSSGEMIEPRSSCMYKHSLDGTCRSTRWTGRMWMQGIGQGIYGLYHEARTYLTSVKSQALRRNLQVYDLACVGPRNRFVIRTDAGPVIVHNCILGLGYGMGHVKFRDTLKKQGGIEIDETEAKRIVYLYRNTYPTIPQLWTRCDSLLRDMTSSQGGVVGNIISYDQHGIVLPNKMVLRYNALRATDDGFSYIGDARAFRKFTARVVMGASKDDIAWTNIYGGKVTENIIQALARIVIADQMTAIGQSYRVILQVHDENVVCVPDALVADAQQVLVREMTTPPVWAPDLPIACDDGAVAAQNYGECK